MALCAECGGGMSRGGQPIGRVAATTAPEHDAGASRVAASPARTDYDCARGHGYVFTAPMAKGRPGTEHITPEDTF